MLACASAAGVPAAWVTGDSVYGDYCPWRRWLEAPPQAYVLAVSGKEYVGLGNAAAPGESAPGQLAGGGVDPAQCG